MAKPDKKQDAPKPAASKPAEAPKADAAEVKSRGIKGVALTAKIKVLASSNPKREGSKARERFAFYKDGMTQEEALNAGVTTPDLVYDASHGFISIDGYAPTLIPVKPKAEKKEKTEAAPKDAAKSSKKPAAGGTEELP